MPLNPSTRLGPYEILAPLGQGGMGEVYRARDARLGREVALKVLPEAFARDADRLARFEREARTLASLSHPNVVVLHSFEADGAIRFVTMELVEGASLAALVTPGGLALERVLELAIPIADALVAAHEKGIVHRDLKPANVMVARDGRVKVLDFGLAKLTTASGSDTTQELTRSIALSATGQIIGTPAYMSPEQIRGEAVDARTDLFSFGILVYELATGRRPFGGDTTADVASAILRDDPPPLALARPELPADFTRLVDRCLAKLPAERIGSASEVVQGLRRLQRALESGAPLAPAAAVTPASSPVPGGATPAPVRARGPSRGVLVAGALVLSIAVAAAAFLLRRDGARGPADGGADRRTVAVLAFENLTGQPALDWMGRGVAELLSAALLQSPELDVFASERLGELAKNEKAAPSSAPPSYAFLAKHGIRRAVTGAILQSGADLRIQGRVVDTENGRTVRSYAVQGPADSGMFHLVGQLIPQLQVQLEVNLNGNREAETWLRDITTSSVDAYRFYLQGHEDLLASRWKAAAANFEKAIELDSTFVAARTELSGAYWNLGDVPNLELTRAAMRRLRGRADHRDQLRIDLLESVVARDPPGLVRAASALVRLYPENRFYTYLLGRGYFTSQQYQRCLETLRPLVEQRYSWAWTYVLYATSADSLGDAATARRAFETGFEVTGDPEMVYEYVLFLRRHGDTVRIRPLLEQALRSPNVAESPVAEGELRFELAKDHALRGDRAAAREELKRSLAVLPKVDFAWPEADSLRRALGPN